MKVSRSGCNYYFQRLSIHLITSLTFNISPSHFFWHIVNHFHDINRKMESFLCSTREQWKWKDNCGIFCSYKWEKRTFLPSSLLVVVLQRCSMESSSTRWFSSYEYNDMNVVDYFFVVDSLSPTISLHNPQSTIKWWQWKNERRWFR